MFSVNLWSCLGGVKPLVVFDGEHEMAVEPMQGNWASSRVVLGYMELFHVAAGTSGSLYTCDSILWDPRGCLQGTLGSCHI